MLEGGTTSFLLPQSTIAVGHNPVLTADIALRREYNRNELEALEAKEMQRLDVSALPSAAESHLQPSRQSRTCIDYRRASNSLLKNKSEGRMMSAAAINKAVIGALGGAMPL